MIYVDLTSGEIDRLYTFHLKHPNDTVRVYSDELVNSNTGEYRKLIKGSSGDMENIADNSIY